MLTGEWRREGDMPEPNQGGAYAVVGTKIYVIGGAVLLLLLFFLLLPLLLHRLLLFAALAAPVRFGPSCHWRSH